MSSDQTVKSGKCGPRPLEEWKYGLPADLTKAFKIYGKAWKFCPKCKSRATGKEGMSHWAKDHRDDYGQQNSNIQQSSINSSPI
jgi:hypothetical protein